MEKEEIEGKENIKNIKMDIFSLGVIIAELFLEQDLFNFTSLLNYKKGNKEVFNIDEVLIKIENEKIRELIYKMIKINPDERISISDALNLFIKEICPISITGFIFQFNAMINSTNFWKPDLIIGHIYRNWNPIYKMFYGPDLIPPKLFQHLNLEIANKIILDDPFYKFCHIREKHLYQHLFPPPDVEFRKHQNSNGSKGRWSHNLPQTKDGRC